MDTADSNDTGDGGDRGSPVHWNDTVYWNGTVHWNDTVHTGMTLYTGMTLCTGMTLYTGMTLCTGMTPYTGMITVHWNDTMVLWDTYTTLIIYEYSVDTRFPSLGDRYNHTPSLSTQTLKNNTIHFHSNYIKVTPTQSKEGISLAT